MELRGNLVVNTNLRAAYALKAFINHVTAQQGTRIAPANALIAEAEGLVVPLTDKLD